MATSSSWLNLTDLGRMYGISALRCGRELQYKGWRDRYGRPTPKALEAGVASENGPHNPPRAALWNTKLCSELLEKTGFQPISKKLQIEQWVSLLEAINEGSPSINTTTDQMAEELPNDLVEDVNAQLKLRGSNFKVREKTNEFSCKAA